MDYVWCMETVTFDLRTWRESRGWTAARLAKAFGVSRWTVKRMEDAGKIPRTVELALQALEHDRET